MKKQFGMLALMIVAGMMQSADALEVNSKMGKPTAEEMSMTTYDPDPEAEAVVLYYNRYTSIEINNQGFVLYNAYKKRIKILKETGKEYGDIEIVVYDEEGNSNRDMLTGLKAVTYNMENGKVVKTKLNDDLKSDQRLDQYFKVVKFSLPNVKVGSVIEVEYKISSDDISTIDPWYAQEEIPVFYTSYETKIPDWFTFSSNMTGAQHIDFKKSMDNFTAFAYGETLTTSAVTELYEGRELPRITDDEFIFCLNDYCTKVTKDITNYTIPGHVYKTYNQDWSHEIGNLMESDYFGRLCKRNNPFEEEIKALKWPEDFTMVQKIDSLRNLLWSRYSWDETYSLYARNTRNLNKEKMGTSATLNFALMNMLNDAGIEAYPVVMNNRLKGRLPARPSRKYLKAMTLAVYNPEDSAFVYVDAGSKDYPVGVIPSQFLVSKAFLLKPATKQFFTKDLRDVCKGAANINLNLSVAADGTLNGSAVVAHRALDAVAFRQEYKMASDEADFIQKKSADMDVEISDYSVADKGETTTERYNIQKQLDIEGDHLYVNPFIGLDFESPFKAETRDLPVEYKNNHTLKYNVLIQIPEGYVVEELPSKLNMKMPDGKLVARINTLQNGDKINLSLGIVRTTMLYAASEYESLRAIHAAIEQIVNSKLVLKKAQ